MNVSEALEAACSEVGIIPPRAPAHGKWVTTDTTSGRNGKGDGRVLIDGFKVIGWNWQTGQRATVSLRDGELTATERETARRDAAEARREREANASHAARIAHEIVGASRQARHPYLIGKGFPLELPLTIHVDALVPILERGRKKVASLVPDGGRSAVVVPARRGQAITTLQLIWEDGTKRFLAGGALGGASHRIARGRDTWLVEGFATGLSIRAALKGLNRADTVLVCFSAGNVHEVAQHIEGRVYIAGENDKPRAEFGGLGTSEHYAKLSGRPYVMPPEMGQDFNDLHQSAGIFEVQRRLATFLREAKM